MGWFDVAAAIVAPLPYAAFKVGEKATDVGAKAAKNLSKKADTDGEKAFLAASPLGFSAYEGFKSSSTLEKGLFMASPLAMTPLMAIRGALDTKA